MKVNIRSRGTPVARMNWRPGLVGAPGVVTTVNGKTGASVTLDDTDLTFLQAGTGAVARTFRAKIRETTVSIADFGATTASSDNVAAIQAAVNFVNGLGGGRVFFPAGTWRSGLFLMKSNVTLCGLGSASVLKPKVGSTTEIFWNENLFGSGDVNIGFENIAFDGDDRGAGAAQTMFASLFQLGAVKGVTLTGVHIRNHQYIGGACYACEKVRIVDCDVYNLGWNPNGGASSANAGDGLVIAASGATLSKDVIVMNSRFYDCRWSPLAVAADGATIIANEFRNNKEAHIYAPDFHRKKNYLIAFNRLDGITRAHISSHGMEMEIVDNLTVIGNRITNCDHGGLSYIDCRGVKVSKNQISNFNKNPPSGDYYAGVDIISFYDDATGACDITIDDNDIWDDQGVVTGYAAVQAGLGGSAAAGIKRLRITNNNSRGTAWTAPGGDALQIEAGAFGVDSSRRGNTGTKDMGPVSGQVTVSATGAMTIAPGFKPSRVEFVVVYQTTLAAYKSGGSVDHTGAAKYDYFAVDSGAGCGSGTGYVWRQYDGAENLFAEATFTSFTETGATLNVTIAALSVKVQWTAYP
jgi:hypothetical protein